MVGNIPIYIQVYTKLKRAIEDGDYRAGEKMPSESELEKMFGVSRITVRKAIELLKNDGFVYVKQGLGTIVASPSMYNSNYVTSFTEQLRLAGYMPSAKNISISHAMIPARIAKAMGVPEDRDMICVQRLQMADDKPIAIMSNYILPELVPNLDKENVVFTSLYRYLEEHYNISINTSRDFITARTADLAQANLLQVPVGFPLIYVVRVSFADGQPVLGDIVYINAYMHEFSFNCAGKAPYLAK
jgi:GntR family transcriptional regulator